MITQHKVDRAIPHLIQLLEVVQQAVRLANIAAQQNRIGILLPDTVKEDADFRGVEEIQVNIGQPQGAHTYCSTQ